MAIGDGTWYAGDIEEVQLTGACSKHQQAAVLAATLCDSPLKAEDLHWVKAEGCSYSLKTTILLACSYSLWAFSLLTSSF